MQAGLTGGEKIGPCCESAFALHGQWRRAPVAHPMTKAFAVIGARIHQTLLGIDRRRDRPQTLAANRPPARPRPSAVT
jgi:hypothetical protein